jgi:glycosyltransferase involved in cell wall biosynthesis
MVEVAEEGRTALLAEPGDATSLEGCLERLIADPALRRALGEAGRRRYEARFAPRPMAEGVVALLRRAAAGSVAAVAASGGPQP